MIADLRQIVLAEDNANDVELTLNALRENHIVNEIVVVRDGAEALDYLHKRNRFAGRAGANPALVLLDLKMPKVDGIEVLRQIKADSSLKSIPVVMLTSSREEQDLVRSYELGVNAYVVKPVAFHEFIDAVKLLGGFWAAINRALGEAQVRREHARAQEAKLFLEDLIAASPSMIFRIDPREFRITYASPNVDRLLGYNQREIVGVRNFWRTLLHQDDLERAAGHLREALESHTVQIPQEYRFRSADGRYRWFFSLMHVEYSDTGGPMRILWYCIDISDRRTAEQALLESEERTRAIPRTANDAFVGADTGGRIVEWNTRAEAMFGWPREEALGRIRADTIVPESYREQHRQGFARFVETGEAQMLHQRLELSALRRDGSEFPVELTIWPTGDGGQLTFNAFIRDITER